MSRLKDLLNGEHGSFFKYAIVATVVFLVLMTFINQDNFIRWMGAKVELKTQARQIEQYRKEIDQMERRIDLLTHDRQGYPRGVCKGAFRLLKKRGRCLPP